LGRHTATLASLGSIEWIIDRGDFRVRRLGAASVLGGGQNGAECYAGRLVYTPQVSMH